MNNPVFNELFLRIVSNSRLELNSQCPDDLSQFTNIYQGPQTSYEARNLCPFRTYFFRVQASNSAGPGPYSPIAATVTPAAPPSAVTILRSDATPTTIHVWWATPPCNGSDIVGYNIDIGSDRLIEVADNVTDYKLEDLQPETQYKVKIQALNAVGAGPFSSAWRTATLRLPPSPPLLELTGSGHNYLKLKWGDGKNVDYTQYCVEMAGPRGDEWQCVYKGIALCCKVNKLHELTAYRFRLVCQIYIKTILYKPCLQDKSHE